MKNICLLMTLLASTQLLAFNEKNIYYENLKADCLRVENDVFAVDFTELGGRMMSLTFKPANVNLTNPETIGSTTENLWNIPKSRFFLREKPFLFNKKLTEDSYVATFSGNQKGGGIDFLNVVKTYTLQDNTTIIKLDYAFENLPDAMSALNYAFLLHHNLGVLGEETTYFYPTKEGIKVIAPHKRPLDLWVFNPARGWLGCAAKSGKGVAIAMDYAQVHAFYSWFSKDKIPTLEWRMIPMSIEAGKQAKTSVEFIAFTGLDAVCGAGNGLVGDIKVLKAAPEPGDQVPLKVIIYNGKAGTVQAALNIRKSGEENWTQLTTNTLEFDKFGTKEFTANVTLVQEGILELEVILANGQDELARLNQIVNFGESDQPWVIAPLIKQRESSIQQINLRIFDNVAETPHIKWGKPLPKGTQPNVLALTDFQCIPEIAQLKQRFDFNVKTTYLPYSGLSQALANPIYSLGDTFGLLTGNDVEENLLKALDDKHDAIVIGGLPWKAFSQKARQKIQEQIKNGTGIVYIGPFDPPDFLGLTGKPTTIKATPSPCENPESWLEGIPFNLLGEEQILAFKPDKDTKILANAAQAPYITEKNNAIAILYKANFGRFGDQAGLTPNLLDFYPDKESQHELYFSLLGKAILKAAGKSLPITFKNADVIDKSLTLNLTATATLAGKLSCFVTTPFNDITFQREVPFELKPGDNKITVPLEGLDYSGNLAVSAILKDHDGNVLNWGTWSTTGTENAQILEMITDKPNYNEGETIQVQLKLAGDTTGCTQLVKLIDCWGRLIQQTESTPGSQADLTIENELLSRAYKINAKLYKNKHQIAQRQAIVKVRPKQDKLVWDDYEIGTWITGDGTRLYLWKHQAEIIRSLNIKTIISNWGTIAHDFTTRHGFHPTNLAGAGLGQASEPEEYTKTKDKTLLVRNVCLSNPEFLQKIKDNFNKMSQNYSCEAMRFFWLGDEQSITGYNGKPIDFCFSNHCLEQFRIFLKDRYKSLDVLNDNWSTDFQTWDQVLPMTRDEVYANPKLVAGWADHLEFMDGRLENVVGIIRKTIEQNDPNCLVSISGTQAPTAYGGMDWWKQTRQFNSLMNYYGGGQHEIHRSFIPSGAIMPWSWGYSSKGNTAIDKCWETLFLGYKGIMGFHYKSLVNPDWTLSKPAADNKSHLEKLANGVGKLVINNYKENPEVAILYSQASIRRAFIENRRDQHRELRSKFIDLFRNLAIPFQFISYEQLENGIPGNFKVIVLADAKALSDKELKSLQDFANNNGKIYAEGEFGTHQANCKIRNTPAKLNIPAQNLKLVSQIDTQYCKALEYPQMPENAAIIEREQKQFQDALRNFGVTAPFVALTNKGKPIRDARIFTKVDRQGNRFVGVLAGNAPAQDVNADFGAEFHVYDLVNSVSYGKVSQIQLQLAQGRPYAFVLLKSKPGKPSCNLDNDKVNVSLPTAIDTVIRCTFEADGIPYPPYSRNLALNSGKATFKLPFTKFDRQRNWKITFREIIGGESETLQLQRP